MPNIITVASSQQQLDEAMRNPIVSDLKEVLYNPAHDSFTPVVDTLEHRPAVMTKANACAGVTCQSCQDEVCAGCDNAYMYDVDTQSATCADCVGPTFVTRFIADKTD